MNLWLLIHRLYFCMVREASNSSCGCQKGVINTLLYWAKMTKRMESEHLNGSAKELCGTSLTLYSFIFNLYKPHYTFLNLNLLFNNLDEIISVY